MDEDGRRHPRSFAFVACVTTSFLIDRVGHEIRRNIWLRLRNTVQASQMQSIGLQLDGVGLKSGGTIRRVP